MNANRFAVWVAVLLTGLIVATASAQTPPSPQATPPCNYFVVGPDQTSPGGVAAGPRLTPGSYFVWVSPRGADGKFGVWTASGPYVVKAGDKYLVEVRDGDPAAVTWIANDVRLLTYSAPVGVGVPYYRNASSRRIDYGFAVCPAATTPPTPPLAAGPPCNFTIVAPWDKQTAPGGVSAGPRLPVGQYFVWVAPQATDGKLGPWSKFGPHTVKAGDKYLVQLRDGSPPTVTWMVNDVRLNVYPAPVGGIGVPYFYNGSERGLNYAFAVCPAPGLGGSSDIVIGVSDRFRFGFSMPGGKRLTFSDTGSTNTTVASVDGLTSEMGGIAGKTVEAEAKLPDGGARASWVMNNVRFTQTLRPVTSASGARDAVLVQWTVQNQDTRPHSVGLRTQIDTLIGNNDGVPFMAPGRPGLITTSADFPSLGPIPDFVQALENPDLKNPGTVAHITLRVRGVEPPDRVSLTRWPGGNTNWDIPVTPMGSDSAIVLYWNERPLAPGAIREFGFSYGLGNVASTEGRIGATTVASASAGTNFPISAYVKNPQPNETVTIVPPQGLTIRGEATVVVPPPPAGSPDRTSVVTWDATATRPGRYEVAIRSSAGDIQRQSVDVAAGEDRPTPPDSVGAGTVADASVASLIAELRHPDPALRLKAAKMLGRMGASATDAMGALAAASEDADADVRRVAADSLKAIEAARAVAPTTSLAKLINDLADRDEVVRLRAAKELGRMGPAARDALPALERLSSDPDEDVRRVAASAIARIREGTPSGGAVVAPPTGTAEPTDPNVFTFRGRAEPLRRNAAGAFDSDYFNLSFRPGERVEIALEGDGSTDVDLWVHDATGKLLVKEIGLTDRESASFVAEASPHRVEIRNIGQGANVYRLKITAPQSAVTGFRPAIMRRSMSVGESDAFDFPFVAGRNYRVSLKTDAGRNAEFSAVGPDGRSVAATASGDNQVITLSPRTTGVWSLRVRGLGTNPVRYSLMVDDIAP